MKIEIAEPGRMTQSGSSLLRLIQNNKTPVLDLLVRESIQNSLDAHKQGARSVTVEYLTGTFSSHKLGAELEGLSGALAKRFPSDKCQYLAVCDSDTVGLTGQVPQCDLHTADAAALTGVAAKLLDLAEDLVHIAGVLADDTALEHQSIGLGSGVTDFAVAFDALVGHDLHNGAALGGIVDVHKTHIGNSQLRGVGTTIETHKYTLLYILII